MPQRKRAGKGKATKRRAPQKGKSWGSFWRGVKNVGKKIGNTAVHVVKDNKLVSKGLDWAGDLGVPYAGLASRGAKMAGLGRRRRQGGRGNALSENTKVMLM